MTFRFFTAAERPELVEERRRQLRDETLPEWIRHDPIANRHWNSLYSDFAELQFFLLDGESLIGEGNAIPVHIQDELPDEGWDWAIGDGGRDAGANAASALQIQLHVRRRGEGLSRLMLERMRELVRARGLDRLVAPVRPTLKARYPLAPIERYARWRRDDGVLFDPWLRTHERLGAEIVSIAHESMRIPGTVEEWERWAGMAFPESGPYVVPEALVPVEIDRERDVGLYVEPNVWMLHRLSG